MFHQIVVLVCFFCLRMFPGHRGRYFPPLRELFPPLFFFFLFFFLRSSSHSSSGFPFLLRICHRLDEDRLHLLNVTLQNVITHRKMTESIYGWTKCSDAISI